MVGRCAGGCKPRVPLFSRLPSEAGSARDARTRAGSANRHRRLQSVPRPGFEFSTGSIAVNISQLPNLITLSRLALTPVLILMLNDRDYVSALAIFVFAGLSDGLDGFIAKRYDCATRLGSILDPLADKILLVSTYVMLTVLGHLPFWLMLVVGFRDLLIVGGYLVYTSMYGPVQMHPSALSKLNTVTQILLVAAVLVEQAAALFYPGAVTALVYAVLVTTVASGGHYVWTWGVMKEIAPARAGKRRG